MNATSRVLHAWAALTGAPALPPAWALGHQHARWGFGSEQEVRRRAIDAAEFRERPAVEGQMPRARPLAVAQAGHDAA